MNNTYQLILTKQNIFESINRTTFTITAVFIALLASTQTQIYEKDFLKFIVKLIALLILCINILYCYNNINDFDKFLKIYENEYEYEVKKLQKRIQYMYILMLLLMFLLLINLYLLIK